MVWGAGTDREGRRKWRAVPSYHAEEEKTFFDKEEAMKYIEGYPREGDLWQDYYR
jgi:hypothetical protein